MTGALALLARHAAERSPDWPEAAREQARRAVTDTLACAIGGRGEAAPRSALGAFAGWRGAPGGAVELVSGGRLPAPWAALVNGTAAHALDYDDVLEPALGHASAVLVPAVLAFAEERGASGAQLLDALLAGYDIMAALGASVMVQHYTRGWHSTLTLGAPAAAAACGRLIGLDATRMAAAISAATSFSSGSKKQFGTAMKPIHAGLAAQAGILAACLAEAGADAATDIFDDESWSFGDLFAGPGAPGEPALRAAIEGPPAMIAWGAWLKAHPCCASTHRPIDALHALRERHGFGTAEIASIEAEVSEVVQRNLMYDRPTTPNEARFSLNHCLALAAEGPVTLAGFRAGTIADHAGFWPRVSMTLDRSITGGAGDERCRLRVTLRDNQVLEETVSVPKGHPGAPLSEAVLARKFTDCAAHAGAAPVAAEHLLGLLAGLAAAPTIAPLTAGLAAL
jgi:2-methylcitrate dehydratase PrpD